MKITYQRLIDELAPGLQELAQKPTSTKVAYNVAKSIKAAQEAIEVFNSAKKNIIESLCKKDDKGKPVLENNSYVFEGDNQIEAQAKLAELVKTEIDVDLFPITINDIEQMKDVTGKMMFNLQLFIKEDKNISP